jgi:hypothetical protein
MPAGGVTATTAVVLKSKEKLRARGIRSSDEWASVALTLRRAGEGRAQAAGPSQRVLHIQL